MNAHPVDQYGSLVDVNILNVTLSPGFIVGMRKPAEGILYGRKGIVGGWGNGLQVVVTSSVVFTNILSDSSIQFTVETSSNASKKAFTSERWTWPAPPLSSVVSAELSEAEGLFTPWEWQSVTHRMPFETQRRQFRTKVRGSEVCSPPPGVPRYCCIGSLSSGGDVGWRSGICYAR